MRQEAPVVGLIVGLSQVLAARCFSQAVNGIVGVSIAWLDQAVAEVDRLLGGITDVGDIAHWVIGIVQVLHFSGAISSVEVGGVAALSGDEPGERFRDHKA